VPPANNSHEKSYGAGRGKPNDDQQELYIEHDFINARSGLPLKGFLSTTLAMMQDMVTACKKLYERGLVANHDGNITCKLPPDGTPCRFLSTPTSFSKGDITQADLLRLDGTGKVVEGRHRVFSEIALHMAIYKVRPDISCVVHGHPPVASGFGIAGQEIGVPAIPEAIVSLGRHILNTQFISPLDLTNAEAEFRRVLAESDAFVLPGNGVWAVGTNIMQTYYRLELVEQIAQQHLAAEKLGGIKRLSPELVDELVKKRPRPSPPQNNSNLRELVAEELRTLFPH
jgi:L-fuculose-phosphate aldolase